MDKEVIKHHPWGGASVVNLSEWLEVEIHRDGNTTKISKMVVFQRQV